MAPLPQGSAHTLKGEDARVFHTEPGEDYLEIKELFEGSSPELEALKEYDDSAKMRFVTQRLERKGG